MKQVMMVKFDSPKWRMIDEYKVANPFIDVGFRQVKDVVDLRVFDLLNISRINNNRAEEMFYQLYNIHLLNGEVIQSAEDYDLPAEKGLVGMFERMKETDILTVNDLLLGSAYIPKRSIVFIATGDVVEGHKYGSKD